MCVTVGIYIFPNVELLDCTGPAQVFITADRMLTNSTSAVDGFRVFMIARSQELVATRGGVSVQADRAPTDHPALDALVVPGGIVEDELADPATTTWIAHAAASTPITASVCTGAFLLAQAGLLTNRRATTHWEDLPELRDRFPSVRVDHAARYVDEGAVITSAGISAGIDMSLHLVERLAGLDIAHATARQMDYPLSTS
jgi:transcriptional regulator GlxA family with amidase domain